jgi:hypothetical protein
MLPQVDPVVVLVRFVAGVIFGAASVLALIFLLPMILVGVALFMAEHGM